MTLLGVGQHLPTIPDLGWSMESDPLPAVPPQLLTGGWALGDFKEVKIKCKVASGGIGDWMTW